MDLLTTNCKPRCCFVISPVEHEEFDFFPISFLWYLTFLLSLTILIIIIDVSNYYNHKNEENITDILFGYSITSFHNNSFFNLHSVNAIHIIDYILIYGIMIIYVWVSLFSWYRYYTTLICTKKLQTVSTTKLLKKFIFYAAIFCVIFILQIHLYYWLFPIIIILFCSFNWYCTYKFAIMLINSCKIFIDMQDTALETHQMLNNVIFTKNISLICTVLHSINLSLFIIGYNVNIIYYMPVLWSISSCILLLNFIRNRRFIYKQYFKLKQQFKCICYKNVKTHKNTQPPLSTPQKRETPPIIINNPNIINRQTSDDKYHKMQEIECNNNQSTIHPISKAQSLSNFDFVLPNLTPMKRNYSDPIHDHIHTDLQDKQPDIFISTIPNTNIRKPRSQSNPPQILQRNSIEFKPTEITVKTSENSNQHISPTASVIRRKKALEVLGIEQTPIQSNNLKNVALSGLKALTSISGSKKSKLSKQTTLSKSLLMESDEFEEHNTPKPVAIAIPISQLVDNIYSAEINDMQMLEKESNNSDRDIVVSSENIPVHGNVEQIGNNQQEELEIKIGNEFENDSIGVVRNNNVSLKDNEMFQSLDVLARYGFCSRKNINSIKQLQKYQQAIHNSAQMLNETGI